MMFPRPSAWLFLGILAGCTGPTDDKSTDDTDDTDDTYETDVIVDIEPAIGDFVLTDFATMSPVADAEITSTLESVTTDASGMARITVPGGELFEVQITHPDYFPVRYFGHNEAGDDFRSLEPLIAPGVASALLSSFGGAVDDAKGHMILSVLTPVEEGSREMEFLGGAELAIDVEFGAAAAQDDDAPGGFMPGTTTADGAIAVFNAATGPANVSITPPAGYSDCNMFPLDNAEADFEFAVEVSAATITRLSIVCYPD